MQWPKRFFDLSVKTSVRHRTLSCFANRTYKRKHVSFWSTPSTTRFGFVTVADKKCISRGACSLTYADMEYAREFLKKKKAFIIDCDGVLYHGDNVLPGAKEFINFLRTENKKFLFLTNASDRSPRQLSDKFHRIGLGAEPEDFYTSAMSCAVFLRKQKVGARAYVVGEQALVDALEDQGIKVVDRKGAEMSTPDFVVFGETVSNETFNYEEISLAVNLVRGGSRLIGTNEDVADRHGSEMIPGTGALTRPVEAASGYKAYFVGKPNPLMISSALNLLDVSREDAVMIGDRMNTDIQAGVEASVDTVLVLSGVSTHDTVFQYAFRPTTVLTTVGDIPALVYGTNGTQKPIEVPTSQIKNPSNNVAGIKKEEPKPLQPTGKAASG